MITPTCRAVDRWLEDLARATADVTGCRGVQLLDERRARCLVGEAPPKTLVVEEPTGRFEVDLVHPGKPGLFMDMREIRVRLAPWFEGRRFLNLFAHTGAFSAAAARAGATEVVSVDLSGPHLAVAERNVELTSPGFTGHEILVEDVFDALARLQRPGRTFDAVLIDPPTFSASKKRGGQWSVKDSYRPVVRAALRILAPGGLLVCATNWRGDHPGPVPAPDSTTAPGPRTWPCACSRCTGSRRTIRSSRCSRNPPICTS